MRTLLGAVALVAIGCAHTTSPTTTTPPATAATTTTPPATASAPTARQVYERATALLYQNDFAGAARQFEELMARARAAQRPDREAWAHNALTWVRWAQHDHAGALEENERVARAAAAIDDASDRRGTMLHYWWDRAYLLEEDPATRAQAAEARKQYEALARMPDEHDGVAVLAAFFAVVEGDGATALARAREVDAAKDDDIQDLYVLQLAYDAGGDHATAERVRALIRNGHEYPMKPVILQRLAYDARRAP